MTEKLAELALMSTLIAAVTYLILDVIIVALAPAYRPTQRERFTFLTALGIVIALLAWFITGAVLWQEIVAVCFIAWVSLGIGADRP